jgi:hypothetical protein
VELASLLMLERSVVVLERSVATLERLRNGIDGIKYVVNFHVNGL